MVVSKNKIWFKNPQILFSDFKIIPTSNMNIEEQLNSITRLILIIFIIILIFNLQKGLIFLFVALLFVLIIYYLQKKNLERFIKEYYMDTNYSNCYKPQIINTPQKTPIIKPTFCNDAVKLEVNSQNYQSINQKLVGKPNPKTLINPIIPEPLANLEYWKTNNLVNFSGINTRTQFDTYNSGYQVSSNCKKREQKCNQETIIEDFEPNTNTCQNDCGYLDKNDNPNIYVQTIQPDVYSLNEVIQPINSNIGITYTPQIGPTTRNISENKKSILFEEHKPDYKHKEEKYENNTITQNDVYDPRFTGYGTSYRSYTDENLGNTKYYYDDINAIRMPNYITRNKLDIFDFAPKYGPQQHIDTSTIRDLANQKFTDSTIEQRTMLQESLMRKRNSEMWQQKLYPMYKTSARVSGGLGFKP